MFKRHCFPKPPHLQQEIVAVDIIKDRRHGKCFTETKPSNFNYKKKQTRKGNKIE